MGRFRYLLAALLIAAGAHAADPWRATTGRLDAYFNALDANGFAHGVIAISEKGTVRYRRALGSAWMGELPSANETSTLFKLGSVSKLFTAILAMQLVEGASITLDGPVAEFYPDLPNALQITYRDLLQHRSGLADFKDDPDFEQWRRVPHPRDEILARITRPGARFAPGQRVQFSESNYLLMGYVLEKVREKPYADLLAGKIAAKLGLARTEYGLTAKPANRVAMSYEFTPDGWRPVAQTDPELLGGAGGVVGNAEDLLRVIDALFGGQLVSRESLDTMRGRNGGPGIGLWPYESAGQQGFGHGGAIEGYRACVYYFPGRGIAIAYTGNAQLLPMAEIIDEALATVFDRRHQPRSYTPIRLKENQLAAYAGTWTSDPAGPANALQRRYSLPASPRALVLVADADGLRTTLFGRDARLVAFGDDEFYAPATGAFLRIHPRTNSLVLRRGDLAYDFRRAE
jgi:CubicO group peptidase (beta-lactamase class C family)